MDIKILDGGLGTECEKRGFAINDDPLWNARLLLSNQDDIKHIHKRFLEAGSDIIETNTYQASVEGFIAHAGLSKEEALNLIHQAGEIAIEAVNEYWTARQPTEEKNRLKPVVAGSIGPYGACQHDSSEYHGNYVDSMTVEDLKNWHRSRFQALLNSGIKMLAIDTIPATKEAKAIVSLLAEFPDVTAWLAFSCKDEARICHGESFREAVAMVSSCPNIVAVGANCCSPTFIAPLLQSAKSATNGKPFVVLPNSGEKWTGSGWTGEREVSSWQAYVTEWIQLGARYIGGCCTIGPEDIAVIRRHVNSIITS
ncbi:homocysteine S-methyltransferase YbgG-like [Anneissia japonica]|uniref:homocysteine S-methyltransferase YbgG-like n=1 Tax=Anneissia japonica TaxID=1529436 RepID=UPI0014258EC6|nr:homocysteine S-methyltransferase YbgG-like [Anneissia japonica]XP_033099793.1 homocysteine S-methyltransferase YbgG-like [Anneissia japonica]